MSKNDFFPFIALILVAGQLFNFLPTEDTVNKKKQRQQEQRRRNKN